MKYIRPILVWVLLTCLFSLFNRAFVPGEVVIQAINAALFTVGAYVEYNLLVKRFLYQGKTGRFLLLFILCTAVLSMTGMISIYEVYVLQKKTFYTKMYWKEFVFYTSSFVLMLLVTSSLLGIRILKDKLRTQSLLEKLEKEKISTELDFLKAQINPHFLFNSLNNILFQIDKSNITARETLLTFSEMLRYQLYDCTTEQIEIEKELKYLRNYIEIQMLRKNDLYDCELCVSDRVKEIRIPPLLLIPFIENAFKYISHHTTRKNVIRIKMDYCNGRFTFCISNDKDHLKPLTVSENKGIGLANVKRRLDLLFPNQYKLTTTNSDQQFDVELSVKLHEL